MNRNMSARGGSQPKADQPLAGATIFGGKKIIIIIICLAFVALFCAQIALAADVKFTPQVSIPGSDFQKNDAVPPSIAKYIKAIYNYAVGLVGILAAVVLMWGGIVWLTSGGNAERVKSAKSWIAAALSGLVLVLTSYLILSTINPDLVSFKGIAPGLIEPSSPENVYCENNNTETSCTDAVGCKWENEKCILNTEYAKCGLVEEEKVEIARCCQKDTEYKYALIPFNQYCINVCGTGWTNVDNNKCETNLGY